MVCKTRNGYQHLGTSPWVPRLQHEGHQGFYSTDNAGFHCPGIKARARTGMISSAVKSWAVTAWSGDSCGFGGVAQPQEPLCPPRLRVTLPFHSSRHSFVPGEQTPLFLSFSAAALLCEGTTVSYRMRALLRAAWIPEGCRA